MSGTRNSDESSTERVTDISKTVQLTAYAANDYEDARAFAQAISDEFEFEIDMDERIERETSQRVLEVDGEEVLDLRLSNYRTLLDKQAEGNDFGDLKVRKKTETREEYAHSPSDVRDKLRNTLGTSLPDEICGRTRQRSTRWCKDNDYNIRLKTFGNDLEVRNVLTHQSERTPDNRFEDDRAWAFTLTLDLNAESEADLSALGSNVTKPLYDTLSTSSVFTKVRITDCKKKTVEEGDCYSL